MRGRNTSTVHNMPAILSHNVLHFYLLDSLLVLNSVAVNITTLKYGKQDFRLCHPLKTALPYYDTLAVA